MLNKIILLLKSIYLIKLYYSSKPIVNKRYCYIGYLRYKYINKISGY